jgi:glycosyltransferase involved in cell wall biosynthesis
MVANLYPEKRHLEVIDTMGRINLSGEYLVALDIYGDSNQDAYGQSVEQAVEKLDFVTWKGAVPISSALLRTYDFAILASSHEGFGNVIIEYIQAGLPFVSSNSDGVAQMVTSNSILILPKHSKAWHQAVIEFIKNPDAVFHEMGYLQEFLKSQLSFVKQFKDVIDSHFSA